MVIIYLARILGVTNYGTLEFAISIMTYFLLFGDGGLELWATREAAQGKDLQQLVPRVLSLRLMLAIGTYGVLVLLLPLFPGYSGLRTLLLLYGLSLPIHAINLKWVFMGQEKMSRVAIGLIVGQIVFTMVVFGTIRSPAQLVWLPVIRLAGDLTIAVYFFQLYISTHGRIRLLLCFRDSWKFLKPALIMGASHGLALVSYNFDIVLLGFMLGPMATGWYSAAYKPVTIALAAPVTFFLGLFPVLSRTFKEGNTAFREIVDKSLRLTAMLAMMIGVSGTFLAQPIINLLFGQSYTKSVLVMQILCWSASLVILRGTFRQALNAAGLPQHDLRCASFSSALNLILNLLLIPRYGIIGAAIATVVSEVLWLTMISYFFSHYVVRVKMFSNLLLPIIAATVMAGSFWLMQSQFWLIQAFCSTIIYFGLLWMLKQEDVHSWVKSIRKQVY